MFTFIEARWFLKCIAWLHLGLAHLFNFNHFRGCVRVSHCGSNLWTWWLVLNGHSYMRPLYSFYQALLPVIMVSWNILPSTSSSWKPVAPAIENATSRQVPPVIPFRGLLQLQSHVTKGYSRFLQWPIQELHKKSAMAVTELHCCSTVSSAQCCFTAFSHKSTTKASLNKYAYHKKLYLSAWFLRNTPYNICF